jgi:hypothetical protein
MSDETNKLTPNDPVDAQTRKKLEELGAARYDVADKLLELEQEKVKILVAANRLDEERSRTFEKILMDRGLAPNTPVEIEAQTGNLRVLRPVGVPSEPKADPQQA